MIVSCCWQRTWWTFRSISIKLFNDGTAIWRRQQQLSPGTKTCFLSSNTIFYNMLGKINVQLSILKSPAGLCFSIYHKRRKWKLIWIFIKSLVYVLSHQIKNESLITHKKKCCATGAYDVPAHASVMNHGIKYNNQHHQTQQSTCISTARPYSAYNIRVQKEMWLPS